MNDSSLVEYIILGGITIFLIKQLYSVLGSNPDGVDNDIKIREKTNKNTSANNSNVIELSEKIKQSSNVKSHNKTIEIENTTEINVALSSLRSEDTSFNDEEFKRGAGIAFELILEAFADEDKKVLKSFLSNNVYKQFMETIQQKIELNERMNIEIVGITSCEISNAIIENGEAILSVLFISEQINTTENRETGEIISGSPSQINTIQDIWTFARNINATDPNWTLIATSAPD